MQTTVQWIADNAIDLADMRRSSFIDQTGTAGTELIRYINLAYRDLYNQIILSREHYFTTSTTISVVANTDSYALPSDFYKLNGVDLQLDSSGRALTLIPFSFKERNKFRSGITLAAAPYGQIFRYTLVGSNIRFLPLPTQSATITLWYTPEPATLTSYASTVTVPAGGEEYMALYAACAMLLKEESDITQLNAKRIEVLNQLKESLKDRDSGSPQKVIDASTINLGALYPFRGEW